MNTPHVRPTRVDIDLDDRIERIERINPADSTNLRLLRSTLSSVADIVEREGVNAYLVGGAVRDLILDRKVSGLRDIDISVCGDARRIADEFAKKIRGRCKVSDGFGTASVTFDEGQRVDFSSSRRERYPAPGALPQVEAGTIEEDLKRRDFTVNALAADIREFPNLGVIDLFDGLLDLKRGLVRVLHDRSFHDDPTRIFRAVRLEQRLKFSIEPKSLQLVYLAVDEGALSGVSGDRIRKEFIQLCDEPSTINTTMQRLHQLGVLSDLVPGLSFGKEVKDLLQRAQSGVGRFEQLLSREAFRFWFLILMVLSSELADPEKVAMAKKFAIVGTDESILLSARRRVCFLVEALGRPHNELVPHEVAALLDPLSDEELLLVTATGGAGVEEWVQRQVDEFRSLQLTITGSDLLRLGYSTGPRLGRALTATRNARLDGKILAAGELDYAAALLNKSKPNKGR